MIWNRVIGQEKKRIVAIILVSCAISVSLLFFTLEPLRNRRNDLHKQVSRMENRLSDYENTFGGPDVSRWLETEQARNTNLMQRWEELKRTVQTFDDNARPYEFISSSRDSRIDFKVELFSARQRLAVEAERVGAVLPLDLGLDETIASAEDSEVRLWQLEAVDKLITVLLQAGVKQILSIHPLPPMLYDLAHPDYAGLQEYPVTITIECSYDLLIPLLEHLSEKGTFFALRAIRIERVDPSEAGILRVQMICGADVFKPAAGATPPTIGQAATQGEVQVRPSRRNEIR